MRILPEALEWSGTMFKIGRKLVQLTIFGGMTCLALAACGTDSSTKADKAGGDAEPFTLTLGDVNSVGFNSFLDGFAARVGELSGGSMQVKFAYEWGKFADDAEPNMVKSVAAGDLDLAVVPTRVFDLLGVDSFEPLSAPFLIDSYELQHAVLTSDIVDDMVAALRPTGVTALGVLEGGLERPVAVDHPLLSPDDYRGITFTAQASKLYPEAIKALGATPDVAWAEARKSGLGAGTIQGFEMDVAGYNSLGLPVVAPYMVANVALWAEPSAIVANPRMLASLSDEQRAWLDQAVDEMRAPAIAALRDESAMIPTLCAAGARFAVATDAELKALRDAVQPVYSQLAANPALAATIDRIERLKTTTTAGAPLDVPADCSGKSPNSAGPAMGPQVDSATADLDGTYRWTLTAADAVQHGTPSDGTPAALATYPWVFTITIHNGRWGLHHEEADGAYVDCDSPGCTLTVEGDTLHFKRNGTPLTFTYTQDANGTLHLTGISPIEDGDNYVFSTEPWERIG